MDGDLAVLASSAATTIVGLMATDAWGQAKEKVAALWRHFQPAQADAIESDLDRARAECAGASEAVALAISREWESRLLRLLAVDTAVAAELNLVIDDLSRIRSGGRSQGSVRQSALASGQSTVIQIGGDGTVGNLGLIRDPPAQGWTQ